MDRLSDLSERRFEPFRIKTNDPGLKMDTRFYEIGDLNRALAVAAPQSLAAQVFAQVESVPTLAFEDFLRGTRDSQVVHDFFGVPDEAIFYFAADIDGLGFQKTAAEILQQNHFLTREMAWKRQAASAQAAETMQVDPNAPKVVSGFDPGRSDETAAVTVDDAGNLSSPTTSASRTWASTGGEA